MKTMPPPAGTGILPAEDLPPVRVLRLERGDILVLHTPRQLTPAVVDYYRTTLGAAAPGHKLIILEAGSLLSVLRP